MLNLVVVNILFASVPRFCGPPERCRPSRVSEGLGVLDLLLELAHPVLAGVLTGERSLGLTNVLEDVLSELQGLGSVDALGVIPSQRRSNCSALSSYVTSSMTTPERLGDRRASFNAVGRRRWPNWAHRWSRPGAPQPAQAPACRWVVPWLGPPHGPARAQARRAPRSGSFDPRCRRFRIENHLHQQRPDAGVLLHLQAVLGKLRCSSSPMKRCSISTQARRMSTTS